MNKIISLEVLKSLYNYLVSNLNSKIDEYNAIHETNLSHVNNIDYKYIKSMFPEVFIDLVSTRFETDEINNNYKVINNFNVTLAIRSVESTAQDDIEAYIYIMCDLLENFKSEHISYVTLKTIERTEVQTKELLFIKIALFDFDIISIT